MQKTHLFKTSPESLRAFVAQLEAEASRILATKGDSPLAWSQLSALWNCFQKTGSKEIREKLRFPILEACHACQVPWQAEHKRSDAAWIAAQVHKTR